MAELKNLHSCRCEDVIIVNNIVDIDNSDICLNICKVTLRIGDRKQLTMTGSTLNGKHINLTKIYYSIDFPNCRCYFTLLQHKESLKKLL